MEDKKAWKRLIEKYGIYYDETDGEYHIRAYEDLGEPEEVNEALDKGIEAIEAFLKVKEILGKIEKQIKKYNKVMTEFKKEK